MNISATTGKDEQTLMSAVLIYSAQSQSARYGTTQKSAYATVHHVTIQHERAVIQSGRPMTDTDFANLVSCLDPSKSERMTWVEPAVLATSADRHIWWTPPALRSVFFRCGDKRLSSAQGVCPTPGLVWMATKTGLSMFAFKGTSRPTPDTGLYQAPFFNVWRSGEVCSGGATKPSATKWRDHGEWEMFFFQSYFTHPNIHNDNQLIKGENPFDFWARMIQKPPGKFPERVLVEITIKAGDLLRPDYRSLSSRF